MANLSVRHLDSNSPPLGKSYRVTLPENWYKVRAIGRQEQDPCTPGLDGFLGGLAFVGRQIIHDDDIAFVEGWCEFFLDVGLEDAPAHRGVDDEGGR
jgi:hypothetical protein